MGLEFEQFYKNKENSFINDIFIIQIYNIFICTCGYDSYTFEKVLDIPLYIPINNKIYQLNNLIRNNISNISVDCSLDCINFKKSKKKYYKNIKINFIFDRVDQIHF